jgi:hypothetical protein
LNALHRSIIAFGQYLKTQVDLEAPRSLSRAARFLMWLKERWVGFCKLFVTHPGQYEAVHLHVPAFLMVQKVKALGQLKEKILHPSTDAKERHKAMKVLGTIMGQDLLRHADPMAAVRALHA